MTISHHPTDETLLRYAAGTLTAGPALVIAVHLERCHCCRARIADFEAVGGRLLEAVAPAPLAAGALERALERLNAAASRHRTLVFQERTDLDIEVPTCLQHCEIGPWRWLGPGFRWSKITIPESPNAKIMFLKGRAGLRLPAHGHTGTEFTQILLGWLSDERGRYGPGDLDEADTTVDHQPIVDPQSECVCLAALDGDTRLHGFLGRLVRPLVGF